MNQRFSFSDKPVLEKYGVPMLEVKNTDGKTVAYAQSVFTIPDEVLLFPSVSTFIFDDAVIRGGEIRGGVIWGGVIRGGEIRGGVIWGGEIWGGEIWGGVIRGGVIRGGEIWGGVIWGGVIWGGVIETTLIQIQTPKYFMSMDYMNLADREPELRIGCQSHTFSHWLENFESIGKNHDFTDDEIIEHKLYIDLFFAKYGKK